MKTGLFHWFLLGILITGLGAITACNNDTQQNQPEGQPAVSQETEPKENIVKKEEKVEEIAVIETSVGTMVVKFYDDLAPGHSENFRKLAREGFYDGTRFHRAIKGFMIQGGCPNTKEDDVRRWGTGSPGYSIKAEFNNTPHVKGTLSMARSADPNSAGSQFFVCHGRAPHLDGQYTAFGELLDGMDTLDAIANAPVTRSPSGENSLPVTPVTIKSVKVMPLSEYKKSA